MSEMPEGQFPTPGPHHARLQRSVGRWKLQSTFFMGPDQPPLRTEGVETIEAHGPFWTVSLYEANLMGMAMRGRATMGYDPVRKKWVATWIDNVNPYAYVFEGEGEPEDRSITMIAEAADPHAKRLTTWRSVTTDVDDDHRVFEMFMRLPTGEEIPLLRHECTRES